MTPLHDSCPGVIIHSGPYVSVKAGRRQHFADVSATNIAGIWALLASCCIASESACFGVASRWKEADMAG